MAANLSAEMQNIDRIVILIDEVRRMKLELLPPTVNLSSFKFTAPEGKVVYGLGAVRGVGEGPVENIIAARQDGNFTSLADFCQRVDAKKVNKRVNEALINAGAFDEFGAEDEDLNTIRAKLRAQLPAAMQSAEQTAKNAAAGITDLFGAVAAPELDATPAGDDLSNGGNRSFVEMTNKERLQGEKESLGLYLTGHPIEDYEQELGYICKRKISQLRAEKKTQWVAGMVLSKRVMKSRRGASMCFIVLDDKSARLEVSLFPECFENFGSKVEKDELLVLEGEVQADDFSGGMTLRAEKVYTIAEARQRFSQGLVIDFSEHQMPEDFSPRLKMLLTPHKVTANGCDIAVLYAAHQASARISLGRDWRVQASDDLLRNLRDEFGSCVHLEYATG